ncbi:hypothetical protein [Bradyrhizobium japonicum]|uniref:hypothetical protein n=1 Tax=Bradyrhizobium japonicum TaxID=375 RepID=UPI0004ACE4B4|nr:hypothetical protein [Bradyrhizobium japonicum]
MPYHVKAGSFLVVTPTLSAAIKLYDDLQGNPEDVTVRDMDGIGIDVERMRAILNESEPS